MRVVVEALELHRDERGSVFEPLARDHLNPPYHMHVVLTEPGCIRGNHYHRRGTEVVIVCGPALIRLRDGPAVEDIHVAADQARRLTIPPGVSHAFQNIGQQPNVIIASNTVPYDPDQPDVVRDVLIER